MSCFHLGASLLPFILSIQRILHLVKLAVLFVPVLWDFLLACIYCWILSIILGIFVLMSSFFLNGILFAKLYSIDDFILNLLFDFMGTDCLISDFDLIAHSVILEQFLFDILNSGQHRERVAHHWVNLRQFLMLSICNILIATGHSLWIIFANTHSFLWFELLINRRVHMEPRIQSSFLLFLSYPGAALRFT